MSARIDRRKGPRSPEARAAVTQGMLAYHRKVRAVLRAMNSSAGGQA